MQRGARGLPERAARRHVRHHGGAAPPAQHLAQQPRQLRVSIVHVSAPISLISYIWKQYTSCNMHTQLVYDVTLLSSRKLNISICSLGKIMHWPFFSHYNTLTYIFFVIFVVNYLYVWLEFMNVLWYRECLNTCNRCVKLFSFEKSYYFIIGTKYL